MVNTCKFHLRAQNAALVWTIFSNKKVHIFGFFEIFVSHVRKRGGLFKSQNFYTKLPEKKKRRVFIYEEKGTNFNAKLKRTSIFVPISLFSALENPKFVRIMLLTSCVTLLTLLKRLVSLLWSLFLKLKKTVWILNG